MFRRLLKRLEKRSGRVGNNITPAEKSNSTSDEMRSPESPPPSDESPGHPLMSAEGCQDQQEQGNNTDNGERNRSVNDFQSKEELRNALLSNTKGSRHASELAWLFSKNQDVFQELMSSTIDDLPPEVDMKEVDEKLDWVLENYDQATTEKQSLHQELRRLLVLKSYLVLDTERKEAFEHVTELASKRFHCDIALISLVDLGRQWFLSNRGLGAHETPRKLSFCAHTIQSKEDCLVVPDATKDGFPGTRL